MVELIVVCGLSLIQAGLIDFCMNCNGGDHATGTEVLEMNLLSAEYIDQVLVELT